MSYSEEFEYGSEWYGGAYVEDWLPKIKTGEDLFKVYQKQQGSFNRMHGWYKPLEDILKGNLLELGHNDGKSAFYLGKECVNLERIDCVDFNESLKSLEAPLRELVPKIDNIWYTDCRDIPKPNEYYNVINCADFYEHLPTDIYHDSMKECYRLLNPGGFMCVFFGKGTGPQHPEHINVLCDEQVIVDMYTHGFKFVMPIGAGYDRLLVFQKPGPHIAFPPLSGI